MFSSIPPRLCKGFLFVPARGFLDLSEELIVVKVAYFTHLCEYLVVGHRLDLGHELVDLTLVGCVHLREEASTKKALHRGYHAGKGVAPPRLLWLLEAHHHALLERVGRRWRVLLRDVGIDYVDFVSSCFSLGSFGLVAAAHEPTQHSTKHSRSCLSL